jgi:hypothetical protein
MGLILEVQVVFQLLGAFYYMLPIAIQLLIMGTFGTLLLLGLFQAVKG